MSKAITFISLVIFLLSLGSSSFAQGRAYEGPDDPAGDISQLREGYMNGNRVLLYFQNHAQMANWWSKGVGDSKWPNNYEGTRMIDGSHLVIFSQAFVRQDSIPVESIVDVESWLNAGEKVDTLYFTQVRGAGGDRNYESTIGWGFYPVRGYLNETQDYIAMSNKPDSWPTAGWPAGGGELIWPGAWNGRFGRGIHYAALESYFVFNDAQDLEYIVKRNDPDENLITDSTRYYPRPGKFIGDIDPTVTVQGGFPWGGMGLRVATRGYQWNNPEARDMIFWEFDISNISDYDLPVMGFGFNTDLAVGDEHGPDDDIGYFDNYLDMAYAWDFDGIAVGGRTPGSFGFAFLESPGIAYDGKDNDDDGLIDEQRDNLAGALVDPMHHIYDLNKFLKFYKTNEEDLREHFQGDEDQDWQDGADLNDDGDYSYFDVERQLWFPDPGETAGDDVGLDGVGPSDLHYNGPDEGECNHKPDFSPQGFGCEPNFAATDISESDMLGLTTFRLVDTFSLGNNFWTAPHDATYFHFLNSYEFDEFSGDNPSTLNHFFSSSTFPLFQGRTERISQGMLHAYESLTTLDAPGHSAPNLYNLKEIAQIIYEADYRFAQPPKMPTLTATAGDGEVILSWNNVADQLTREPFLGNINDFEGYKLYRATDKLFSDAEIVTNSQGVKMDRKPIFQCDLVDSLVGHALFGTVAEKDGLVFYLGNDTGIRHTFVDKHVQNGRTYYYALVAYDYGAPHIGKGIAPAENNIVMELDEAEEIVRMGDNVVVVTPRQNAAGFEEPSLTYEETETIGNAKVTPMIYDRDRIKPGHTYQVHFAVDTVGHLKKSVKDRHPMDAVIVNNGLSVYDVTEGGRLVYKEDLDNFPMENIIQRDDRAINYLMGRTEPVQASFYDADEMVTDVFDGIQLKLSGLNGYLPHEVGQPMPATGISQETSGWIVGNAPITVKESRFEYYSFPFKYDIIFTDNDAAFVNRLNKKTGINNLNGGESDYLFDQSFPFYVLNQTAPAATSRLDTMELVVEDLNANGTFDLLEDRVLVGAPAIRTIGSNKLVGWGGTVFGIDFQSADDASQLPKADDIYRLDFSRPFYKGDSIIFSINEIPGLDESQLNSTMDDIKVVPNPYVMTNSMEPAVANKFLNQRRRIMFTHVPAQCEIRIFTSSGVLVDKIDVTNEPSSGIVHWDLLSKEDLEVAAGMYVYHIKSTETGKEKVGKFALVK
jgi:hypothetical protein